MAGIDMRKLFSKLNSLCYKSMEASMIRCKMLGHSMVGVEHWLEQVLQLQDSDLLRLMKAFEMNPSRLASDLTAALGRIPRGATSVSGITPQLHRMVEEAWTWASLRFDEYKIRSAHCIIGMMENHELRSVLLGVSREFEKVKIDDLIGNYEKLLGESVEAQLAAREGAGPTAEGAMPGEESGAMAPAQMGKEEAIKRFCKDLTEQARSGKIDPIVGRDDETRQVVDILMRRRQNNPLLTGEAGVGKTAVVEGFAHKIVSGDVPPPMRDVRLLELDVAALQAGASMKGEFEQRLKQVIEEVQASTKPIILFIDEAHTLMGAGGQAGTGDAAQLLKPALARGTLRTIAATTWSEYKKHIEKDPALTRRFQVVKVDEPTEEKAILMMRKVAGMLERHHKVQILDEAVEAAVRLSHRYIPARQLPDKSVSLLDTACARVAVGQHAVPADVDDTRKRIDALKTEREILEGETRVGMHHDERVAVVDVRIAEEEERLAELEANWKQEKDLVDQILVIRAKLRGPSRSEPVEGTGSRAEAAAGETLQAEAKSGESAELLSDADRAALISELEGLQGKLSELQGDSPLILASCDAQAVSSVVADWTGIPVGKMVKNEIEAVLKLADTLNQRIIGQRHALDAIAKRIQTSRAGIENPNKPIGVFMLAGTSGVGKTETALALAEALYGGEDNVITINMSEYQEAHKVATLMGPPPGYVGFGSGGVLTEAVRRKPYSIVLLDEVEKAHADVHEIFFQVFDKGVMKDSEGTEINFRNTIILLTTNAGTDLIMNMCKDPELLPDVDALQKALREPLLKVFPAALLGRLVVIPYYPLNDTMIREITRLQLGRLRRRIAQSHEAEFDVDDAVYDLVVSRCTEIESGGRMIDAILTQTMLPTLSTEFLGRMMQGQSIRSVRVGVKDGEFEYSFE
ncbi:MAG: type VI secretion system ATPase TssH [Phycisphaeraceae bacterium]|nr:type VI secretion system ATPase TssH [Phycisphaeraceae bacterium]